MTLLKNDLAHLFNQATTKLPGASRDALKSQLYDVLNDFFNLSSSWTEDITLNIVPNTQTYSVVPAEGGQIIRLEMVLDENRIAQPAVLKDFDTVVFANPYNVAQTFTATVTKNVTFPVPKDSIPEAPDWTLSVFGTTILDGLVGNMMLQQAKPYSNESLGQYHMKDFNNGVAMARVAKQRANTRGAQAWRFPQGFASGSQRGGVSTANPNRF